MFHNKTFLSVIGARAGSKGLKNKNVRDFAGKPLIAWSIEASVNAKLIDRTIVTTDSDDIASVSKKYGADVPFSRPKELATDESSLNDVVIHTINWLKENESKTYDYVVLLMPSSPLRTPEELDAFINYYFNKKKSDDDTLICAHILPQNYAWVMQTKPSGYSDFCFDYVKKVANRQELPQLYIPSGLIYIAPTEVFLKTKSFYTDKTILFPTREEETIDIDTEEDWQIALKIHADRERTGKRHVK